MKKLKVLSFFLILPLLATPAIEAAKPGGDEVVLEVQFTPHGGGPKSIDLLSSSGPAILFSPRILGGGVPIDTLRPVESDGTLSDVELVSSYLHVRTKGGVYISVALYFMDTPFGVSGGTTYRAGIHPVVSTEPGSDGGFTLHIDAIDVELRTQKNKPSIGCVRIGDIVYTPAP